MSVLPDETVVMITRTELFRLLTKAAAKGGDRAAMFGSALNTYEVLDIAQEILDDSKIPAVSDQT